MAPIPKSPGVYVDEISPHPPSIDGVATAITAFVGATTSGPLNKPTRITSFAEFERQFGTHTPKQELGYALRQFFANGGKEAMVVKVGPKAPVTKLITGIQSLDAVELFNLLVLPGITAPAVLSHAADYCRKRRAFLIVDSPATAKSPMQMLDALNGGAIPRTSYAAIYFPWIKIADPLGGGQPRVSAPSGTIAGAFSQQDIFNGVWKAPANISMRGVIGLEYEMTARDSDLLSPVGVNCLRNLAGRGTRVWGARTLDDTNSSDWKFISTRRLALFIEQSVQRGTQWAVFEPNAAPTWVKVQASVENFLFTQWRTGALQGKKAAEAYFVKCDRTTMTQSDIDNGRLLIEIGIAMVKPAEFVILRIGQQMTT